LASKKEGNLNLTATTTSASSSSSASPTNNAELKQQQEQPRNTKPIDRPANATTRPGAQKYNQVVNSQQTKRGVVVNPIRLDSNTTCAKVIASTKKQEAGGDISPSVDLNLKIESCKKVWETSKKSATTIKDATFQNVLVTDCLASIGGSVSSNNQSLSTSTASETDQTLLRNTVRNKSPIPSLMSSYYESNTSSGNTCENNINNEKTDLYLATSVV